MISKNVLKKVIPELPVPVLFTMIEDAANQAKEKEDLDDFLSDQIFYIESCTAEIRKRFPQTPRKKKEDGQ